jgi:CheY-like chemotaxis protein
MSCAPLILIVDDHESNRRLLRCQLEFQGYQVVDAADGPQGLAMCRQNRPDLVMLDLRMPGMSGFEMMRAIKTDPSIRAIPCIAVTAMSSMGERQAILASGFDDYLSKPYLIHDLQTVLGRILKRPSAGPAWPFAGITYECAYDGVALRT